MAEFQPQAAAAAPRVVRREVREFLRKHEQRRRQLPRALLVGVIAGLAAVGFRGALEEAERLRDRLVQTAYGHPALGWVLLVSFCACGVATSIWLVRRWAPDASGSGIPQVKAILHGVREMVWWRLVVVKFVGGVSGIGAGLALGREGPTIQMGAAIGQMVSGWFRRTSRERRTRPDHRRDRAAGGRSRTAPSRRSRDGFAMKTWALASV